MSRDSQSGETIASRYNGIGRFSVEGVIKIAQVEILYTKEVDFSKERSIFFEKKEAKNFYSNGLVCAWPRTEVHLVYKI